MAKLRDEYVAGRLSHDTFMHRVHLVMETQRQADLPPLVADLPTGLPADLPTGPPAAGRLAGWLRGTWSRATGAARVPPAPARPDGGAVPRARSQLRRPFRAVTTGMAVSPARRQLLSLQFPRAAGERFTIGRDASCDLAIADMTVSRQHAQLERTADGWLLSDLESTNGTRVNGWRVRGQVPVKVGDLVSFGNLEVILARSDEPA